MPILPADPNAIALPVKESLQPSRLQELHNELFYERAVLEGKRDPRMFDAATAEERQARVAQLETAITKQIEDNYLADETGPPFPDADELARMDAVERTQSPNSMAISRLRSNPPSRKRRGVEFPSDTELARDRHPQRDFWLADIIDIAFKDDVASMEAPVYALSKRPDKREATWVSPDGKKKLFVFETTKGRATIFDKDILIYATSQMTAALNQGKSVSRTMRYRPYDFFVTTNRDTGGDEYTRHKAALERLQGTSIQTNIATGGTRTTRQFSLIESWEIVEKDEKTGRAISVAITLNEWMMNAIAGREVLTMNKDYFRLSSPIDRRLYELARKHGFTRGIWTVSWDNLYSLTGSVATMKEFRRSVREAQERNVIPDFLMMLDDDGVTFKRHPIAIPPVDKLPSAEV